MGQGNVLSFPPMSRNALNYTEKKKSRNSCPCLPVTYPGDMVVRMRTVMVTTLGWCNVRPPLLLALFRLNYMSRLFFINVLAVSS